MGSKYHAYPEYKDSGSNWLGEIPVEWRVYRGKFVFSEYGERSETGDETLLSVSEYYGVKPRGDVVDDGDFLSRAESLVGYKKCNKNDLVMNIMLAWKRGLGVTKYNGIVSPAYSVFRFNENASPDYMHYLLRTDIYVDHFKTRSTGVIDSRLRLYPDSFADVSILLPSINEQEKIANFLDHETAKIDTLIEKQQQLIKLLKEKRQAVISHAVTKGLNPNAKMRDSGVDWLGEVPEHWVESRIKFYCSVKGRIGFRGYTVEDLVDNEDGALVIGATEMNSKGEIILNSPQYISWMKYYESPEIMLEEGMILVVQRGSTVGKVANIPSGIGHATINPSLIVLRDLKINSHYLLYSIMGSAIQSLVKTQTSVTAIPMISQEQVGNYWLLIPPICEQSEINAFINFQIKKTDDAINYSEKSIELLNERRTALISAAVTGKIDVRDWQALND